MEFGLNEVLTIIDKVKSTELSLFEYQDADTRIKIKGTNAAAKTGRGDPEKHGLYGQQKHSDTAAGPEALAEKESCSPAETENQGFPPDGSEKTAEDAGHTIASPMVGTFYAAPSRDEAPFVQVGGPVKKGQTIGIVEAMKLMNEIESDCDGTVEAILVENEQMVEYGQPLIRIRVG